MKKFIIESTGCSRRDLDAERICKYLIANGLERTASPEEADYMIVVTCGLTKDVTDKSIAIISNFQKYKGEVIVYGCLPAMNPKKLGSVHSGKTLFTKDIGQIDKFFNFPIKFKDIADANKAIQTLSLPEKTDKKLTSTVMKTINLRIGKALNHPLASFFEKNKKTFIEGLLGGIGFDNRFFTLRISEGCVGNCSYCTIKKAIGKLKSKPISAILAELRNSLSKKQYHINIASSDAGSYGVDIGSNLPQLLNAILNENKKVVIEFIQDLHPSWICRYKEDMVKLIRTKRIKSILTAIESGNERVLKLMNRHTDLKEFMETIKRMKEAYPRLRLRTQVIAGFPTETEDEFEDTVAFLKKCKFDEVDIFAYYEVGGSKAEGIFPKVPPEIILRRVERLDKSLTISHRIGEVCKVTPKMPLRRLKNLFKKQWL